MYGQVGRNAVKIVRKLWLASLFAAVLSFHGSANAQAASRGAIDIFERSGDGSIVEIRSEPVVARVRIARNPGDDPWALHVSIVVQNESASALYDVAMTLRTGRGLNCERPSVTFELASRATHSFRIDCMRIGRVPSEDPTWGHNQPVGLDVSFTHEGVSSRAEYPIGYARYYAWPANTRLEDAAGMFTSMALQGAPGLRAIVGEIRHAVEARLGHALDRSSASRIATATAVAEWLRGSGIRYERGGDTYHGPRPAMHTTNFPAETIAFGVGACDDLAVLGGFLLHELGVPFATMVNLGHVRTLVEIDRAPHARNLAHGANFRAVDVPCDGQACRYLPIDFSAVVAMSDDDLTTLRDRAYDATRADLDDATSVVWVPSSRPPRAADVDVGHSWLGSSPAVRVYLPRDTIAARRVSPPVTTSY